MTGYASMDASDLRAELEIVDAELLQLLTKLIEAIEADDQPWVQSLVGAVKVQVARKKHLRRCMIVEVA